MRKKHHHRRALTHCISPIIDRLESRTLLAAAGDLDPTFGDEGKVTTELIASQYEYGRAVVVQPDGRILVAGSVLGGGTGHPFLLRYLPDGSPDVTFGDSGNVDLGSDYLVSHLAVDSLGRIIAAGAYFAGTDNKDFAVIRLNADGTPDNSFDGDGIAVTALSPSDDEINGIAIDTSDRIVAVGVSGNQFSYVRYATDGIPDAQTIHGTNPLYAGSAESVALQPDGKLVLAGTTGGLYFQLARLNPDGTLDAAFGDGGVVESEFPVSMRATTVAIDADGRIIAGGQMFVLNEQQDARAFALARYLPDGSPDPSFNDDGMVTTDFEVGGIRVRSVLPLPDGRILAVGETAHSDLYSQLAAVRYNADGSPDVSFGDGNGILVAPYLATAPLGVAEAVRQPDGRLVVVGATASAVTMQDLALIRYNDDFTADDSFDGDGHIAVDFHGPVGNGMRDAAIGPDGSIVAAGYQYLSSLTVASRYLPDGSLDPTLGGGGTALASLSSAYGPLNAVQAVAVQADGRAIVAGMSTANGDLDVAMIRFNPDGTLDADFGDGGIVLMDIIAGDEQIGSIALQPDGKILLGGVASHPDDGGYTSDILVVRFNSDGSLDESFANVGYALIDYDECDGAANHIAVQSDGKILVAGSYYVDRWPGAQFATLTRLLADGQPDEGFGSNGRMTVDFAAGAENDAFQSVLLYPGGRILAHAQTESDDFLARYHADGTPDESFGTLGVLTAPHDDASVAHVLLQPDGRIVLGGSRNATGTPSETDLYFARLLSDGTIDLAFADDGWSTIDFGGQDHLAQLLMTPTGGIVAAGTVTEPDGDRDFALAKLVNDAFVTGTPDDDTIFARVADPGDAVGPRLHVWLNANPDADPPTHELPLSSIAGLHIDAGAGNDIVTLETSALFPQATLLGGDGADHFAITGSGTAAKLTIEGGAGDDALAVDTAYSMTAVTFPIQFTGGDGDDNLAINGTATDDTYSFQSATFFTAGNHAITTDDLAALHVNAAAGDDNVSIVPNAPLTSVTILGGDGNDTLDITLSTHIHQFRFDGDAGDDVLTVREPTRRTTTVRQHFEAGEGNDAFRVFGTSGDDGISQGGAVVPFTTVNAIRFDLADIESEWYDTGAGDDSVGVGEHDVPVHVETGDGDDSLTYRNGTRDDVTFRLANDGDTDDHDFIDLFRGDFVFTEDLGLVSPNLTIRTNGPTTVRFEAAQSLHGFMVTGRDTVTMAPGGDNALNLREFTLSSTATLDLNDNDLHVLATPSDWTFLLRDIEQWIGSARNADTGRWTGPGITTSTAKTAPLTGLAVWANDQVDGPWVPITVKYTWNGDATLDGKIDADDYFRIDSGFLAQPPNPLHRDGDFNYDDRIDADDYFLIDSAFLGQGAPLSHSQASAPAATVRVSPPRAARSVAPAWQANSVRKRAHRVRPPPVF